MVVTSQSFYWSSYVTDANADAMFYFVARTIRRYLKLDQDMYLRLRMFLVNRFIGELLEPQDLPLSEFLLLGIQFCESFGYWRGK